MSKLRTKNRIVPVTLDLALKFRDMRQVEGERELKAERSKVQAKLLEDGKLLTLHWGCCNLDGETYRTNGKHTSHLVAACLQATIGELDTVSTNFLENTLYKRGGKWSAQSPEDLPELHDGDLIAVVEEVDAESEEDLIELFRRWDARSSARDASDELSILMNREAYNLTGIEKRKYARALAGAQRAAKVNPEQFGFSNKGAVPSDRGGLINCEEIRECSKWIVETVSYEELYVPVGAAQGFAEMWANYTEEEATQLVKDLIELIDEEDNKIAGWYNTVSNKRKRPTIESLVKDTRNILAYVAKLRQGKQQPAQTGRVKR